MRFLLELSISVNMIHTSKILSPGWSLPSLAAAPVGFTVVTKIPGSSPTWMLSTPPLILNPRPVKIQCKSVELVHYSIMYRKLQTWLSLNGCYIENVHHSASYHSVYATCLYECPSDITQWSCQEIILGWVTEPCLPTDPLFKTISSMWGTEELILAQLHNTRLFLIYGGEERDKKCVHFLIKAHPYSTDSGLLLVIVVKSMQMLTNGWLENLTYQVDTSGAVLSLAL